MAKQTMYSNPIGLGADLAEKKFKNELATPNVDDEDAALFAKIGKIAGDKPKGWNALLSGLATGAEYGSRTKSTAKKQEALSKYDKVMEYFQEVNHAAAERNKWYETRELAQQKYLPQIMSYANNITKLDPQSQRLMAQNILDGWNRTTGDDYQLSSIDGTDPFVMTINSKKGAQVIDIRDMFSGNEALQNRLAMKTPEYQMQLQEKRQHMANQLALEKEKIEILKHKEGLESKLSPAKSQNTSYVDEEGNNYVPLDKLEPSAVADFQKLVTKKIQNIPVNENSINTINTMQEIFTKYPDIGDKFVNLLDNNDESSWSNLVGRMLLNKDEIAAMEILKKSSSDLNLSTVLGISGKAATDILKQTIKTAAPHGKLTKKGFDKISNEWKQRALFNIQDAENGLKDLTMHRMTKRKRVLNNSSPQDAKGIIIFDPDTNETVSIPEDKLDAAIAGGWMVKDESQLNG